MTEVITGYKGAKPGRGLGFLHQDNSPATPENSTNYNETPTQIIDNETSVPAPSPAAPVNKRGRKPKKDQLTNDKNVKTTLYLPSNIRRDLKHLSADTGIKVNDLIVRAVSSMVAKETKNRDKEKESKSLDGKES